MINLAIRSNRPEIYKVIGFISACLLNSAMSGDAGAQGKPREFEFISVKTNTSGIGGASVRIRPDGRWIGTNLTIMAILQSTFGLQESQIVGGPEWIKSARFDIVAQPPALEGRLPTKVEMNEMFQSLLAARFDLKSHWDTRSVKAYSLAVDKKGSRLKLVETPSSSAGESRSRVGEIHGRNVSLKYLIDNLAVMLRVPIQDETGIVGKVDFDLEWNEEAMSSDMMPSMDPSNEAKRGTLPGLATALRDQLGLTLQARRSQISVFLVDNVSRPDSN